MALLKLLSRLARRGFVPPSAGPVAAPDLLALYGARSFERGVHPPGHKDTAGQAIRRLPFAPRLVLPLSQHMGRPAVPLVRPGQEVLRGEPVARADGLLSVPLHAPATGRIEEVELRPTARGVWAESIVLRVHQADTQQMRFGAPRDVEAMTPAEIVQAVQDAGLVGLGGAAFPTHAKLVPPEGAHIHTLVVNGCECEPYLTCDHRLMLERPEDLVAGIRLAMKALGARRAAIAVEDNKPDALAVLQRAVSSDGHIGVHAVATKYPQGAERMLIKALFGRELPAGALPASLGVVVNNAGTLAMLGRLLARGEALVERVITLAGPGIARPGDYWVPLGTPLSWVLAWAGARCEAREVILGGPMMGQAVADLDAPVTKGVSGVLVFPAQALAAPRQAGACIKCGECVAACPMGLNPSTLGLLAAKREYALMDSRYHLGSCFECGSCSYVCPAHIPLVQQFRVARQVLRERAAA